MKKHDLTIVFFHAQKETAAIGGGEKFDKAAKLWVFSVSGDPCCCAGALIGQLLDKIHPWGDWVRIHHKALPVFRLSYAKKYLRCINSLYVV